jgi:hypothetical protein
VLEGLLEYCKRDAGTVEALREPYYRFEEKFRMNVKIVRVAAPLTLAFLITAPAMAQSTVPAAAPALSLQRSQRGTWQTVLLVSAAVGIVGLLQGDTTLTLLGGAGVLLSLYETNRTGFRPQPFRHGIDLLSSGPVSFGIQPLGQFGLSRGLAKPQPSAYIQATFKF